MHHRRGLRRLLKNDEQLAAIERNRSAADLGDRQNAMLAYVEKLTNTPAKIGPEDIDTLRAVGFVDRDILDIAEVTAYCAYVNRIADGLGVDLEPWFSDDQPR